MPVPGEWQDGVEFEFIPPVLDGNSFDLGGVPVEPGTWWQCAHIKEALGEVLDEGASDDVVIESIKSVTNAAFSETYISDWRLIGPSTLAPPTAPIGSIGGVPIEPYGESGHAGVDIDFQASAMSASRVARQHYGRFCTTVTAFNITGVEFPSHLPLAPPDAIGVEFEDDSYTIVNLVADPSRVYGSGPTHATWYMPIELKFAAAPEMITWEPDNQGFSFSTDELPPFDGFDFTAWDDDPFLPGSYTEYPVAPVDLSVCISSDQKSVAYQNYTLYTPGSMTVVAGEEDQATSWLADTYRFFDTEHIKATILSPRYRWIYPSPKRQAPPCRIFPRDDSLGVGSGRIYPPPVSQQASSRRAGTYY